MAEPLGRGEPPPRCSARDWQRVRIAFLRPTVLPGGGRSPVALGIDHHTDMPSRNKVAATPRPIEDVTLQMCCLVKFTCVFTPDEVELSDWGDGKSDYEPTETQVTVIEENIREYLQDYFFIDEIALDVDTCETVDITYAKTKKPKTRAR